MNKTELVAAIADAAELSKKDSEKALKAFVDVVTEELKKELQTYVKKETAPYKYPRVIEFVDSLPKTVNGKIRRTEIRANDLRKLK